MKKVYQLIKVETFEILPENQVREVVLEGTHTECMGKFLRSSCFSFSGNNDFSYTQYFIEEVVDESITHWCVSFWLEEGINPYQWIKDNDLGDFEVEYDEGQDDINGDGERVNVSMLGDYKLDMIDKEDVVSFMIEREEEG